MSALCSRLSEKNADNVLTCTDNSYDWYFVRPNKVKYILLLANKVAQVGVIPKLFRSRTAHERLCFEQRAGIQNTFFNAYGGGGIVEFVTDIITQRGNIPYIIYMLDRPTSAKQQSRLLRNMWTCWLPKTMRSFRYCKKCRNWLTIPRKRDKSLHYLMRTQTKLNQL